MHFGDNYGIMLWETDHDKQKDVVKIIIKWLVVATAVQFIYYFLMKATNTITDWTYSDTLGCIRVLMLIAFFGVAGELHRKTKYEKKINEEGLNAQKDYYTMLLKKDDDTKAFRHDFRHHMVAMESLNEAGKTDELGEYIKSLKADIESLSPRVQTGDDLVNAILADIMSKYPEVEMEWEGYLNAEKSLPLGDMCSVFYNLFLNAFEAAEKESVKKVKVTVSHMENKERIEVENKCTLPPHIINGKIISSKEGVGHGYGIKNIIDSLNKNHAFYDVEVTEDIYKTTIII